MGKNNLSGAWGEALAAEYLRKKRYKLVAAGYHCRFGEIDLIVQNKQYLVFVEVKTRHVTPHAPSRYGRPAAAIDKSKRARMRKAAEDYLREHPTSRQPRIDVAEVYLRKRADGTDEVLEIKIYPAAYAGR